LSRMVCGLMPPSICCTPCLVRSTITG
jgi:hypothetical protein